MIIVGVGAGPGMLTQEAIKAIGEANLIYGSKRSIDLVREHIKSDCAVKIIEDYKRLHELPEGAVVLSTGDPMLSGLGYLKGRVVPGISSMQVACARLKISQLDVIPITIHGREMNPVPVAEELRRGKCVFLLIDERTDIERLCSYLESNGLSRNIAVLANLGYPEERIMLGRTSSPSAASSLSCSCMMIF
jgi:cobalt-precorrin-7 (C5)-methyltransferase